jgi:hypothetical protein
MHRTRWPITRLPSRDGPHALVVTRLPSRDGPHALAGVRSSPNLAAFRDQKCQQVPIVSNM